MIRTTRLAALLTSVAASVLCASASSAGAGVTIGETFVPAGGDDYCTANYTWLTQYATPSPGVITSWSFQADSTPPQLKFKAGHPAGGSDFAVIGESTPKTPAPDSLNTYTDIRISVQAGDVIGLYVGTRGDCLRMSPAHTIFYKLGDQLPGTTVPFTTYPGWQLDVSAVLEPDADQDGFGDETQDRCLGTAGRFNGCSKAVTLGKIKAKRTKVKVTATVPGPGTLSAGSANDPTLATAAAKTKPLLKAVTETLSSNSMQQVALTLKLTKSAKQTLSQNGKLALKVKAVFTPTGGPSGSPTKKKKKKLTS